jgi:hypothetical protein
VRRRLPPASYPLADDARWRLLLPFSLPTLAADDPLRANPLFAAFGAHCHRSTCRTECEDMRSNIKGLGVKQRKSGRRAQCFLLTEHITNLYILILNGLANLPLTTQSLFTIIGCVGLQRFVRLVILHPCEADAVNFRVR